MFEDKQVIISSIASDLAKFNSYIPVDFTEWQLKN